MACLVPPTRYRNVQSKYQNGILQISGEGDYARLWMPTTMKRELADSEWHGEDLQVLETSGRGNYNLFGSIDMISTLSYERLSGKLL